MLKQPERDSRNVNDLFYEMEGRQIRKMNKVLSVIEKVARIRANKKGGYAHKSKCESEK